MTFIKLYTFSLTLIAVLLLPGCDKSDSTIVSGKEVNEEVNDSTTNLEIRSITTSGQEGSYSFSVEIKSHDTGCEQYADWWEVIDTSGMLLYRRILLHSHVTEQPFKRSGGPIDIQSNTQVIIRGHMNNSSYSTLAMSGSVLNGFHPDTLKLDFALNLETVEPLPENCDF